MQHATEGAGAPGHEQVNSAAIPSNNNNIMIKIYDSHPFDNGHGYKSLDGAPDYDDDRE